MRTVFLLIAMLPIGLTAAAASKPHVVSLGKATPVKLFVGSSEDRTIDISVRPLYVDSKLKDFTTGETHDVTDREFVVRQGVSHQRQLAGRSARSQPSGSGNVAAGCWSTGVSGKIALVKLPDFDAFYSEVSWYRDYAAYCGITSNGERVDAVVAEIGGKKPLFHKELGKVSAGDSSDKNCAPPRWDRQPAAGDLPA